MRSHSRVRSLTREWREALKQRKLTELVGDHEAVAIALDGFRFRGERYPTLAALPEEGKRVVGESRRRYVESMR